LDEAFGFGEQALAYLADVIQDSADIGVVQEVVPLLLA